MQKRLSARKGDTAAREIEKSLVFEQFFGKCLYFPFHARRADKILRADVETPPDLLTFGVVAGFMAKSAGKAAVLL